MLYRDPNTGDFQLQAQNELFGQRGYGFLLTGTITTLDAGQGLTVTGDKDVIVRGNINLLGAHANLLLQSDSWIYWEGFANVAGDISFYGGVELNGSNPLAHPMGGANADGVSLFVHATSTLNTLSGGSHITLRGGQDVILNGPIVAGGLIGPTGVSYQGSGDSTVSITAGQRILVDTFLGAAYSVTLTTTAAPGAGDDGVAVQITSAGGLTAAGITSDHSGGLAVCRQLVTALQQPGRGCVGRRRPNCVRAQSKCLAKSLPQLNMRTFLSGVAREFG